MADDIFSRATTAADFIHQKTSLAPKIAIVLGSGLGEVASQIVNATAIPYAQIPNFPRTTVEGHNGRLLIGTFAETPVAIMQGRVHSYEGYSPLEVTFPLRVLGRMGINRAVVTNAAGGINTSYTQGSLVLIRDHINFTGLSPLTGPNDDRLGLRFFDMSDAYSARLRALAQQHSANLETGPLNEGIYIAVPGPSYETPAEIRAFRSMGADLVGMSTVHEVIVAHHMQIEVLGISCVTNMAAGVLPDKINHLEVMEIGRRVESQLTALLKAIVPEMAQMTS
jgi:purine-nucleoside phosphorylase